MRTTIAAAALALTVAAAPSCQPDPQAITVHADQPLGPAVVNLAGVTWNGGDLEALLPFVPPSVRFGAQLDEASPREGVLDLSDVIDKAQRVRAMGGVPVVTLSKMPAWLARPVPPGCRETRRGVPCVSSAMGPTDYDKWGRLVDDVVTTLAGHGVYAYEVWNEPNNVRSWADTEDRFLTTAFATHVAVDRARRDTGLLLAIGGPATGEVSDLLDRYIYTTHPDFISWHDYAKDPTAYRDDAAKVRSLLPPGPEPDLVVSEWNLYGRKTDARVGAPGAAFALAALIEMESAGIDRANIYRGVATGTGPEAAGLITGDGAKRSSWWVLDAWSKLHGQRLAVDAPNGVTIRATRNGDRVDVLAAAYGADLDLPLTVDGCTYDTATVRRIDKHSTGFDHPTIVDARGLRLKAKAPTALWVTLDCG